MDIMLFQTLALMLSQTLVLTLSLTLAQTLSLTISGADADLSKVGSASWLTIPATSVDGVPFNVEIDASAEAAAGNLSEVIRATSGGFDDLDVAVSVKVLPEGPKA